MKKTYFIRLVFAALVAVAFAQTPALAKDEWIRVQSQNFSLIGNASDKEVRRVATKLEQFREGFKRLLPQMKLTSPIPTTVIVFNSNKDFQPYKPVNASGKVTDWIAGYFQSSDDSNYIVLSLDGENAETYKLIYHEYVHYLMNNSLGRLRVPPWFNEGIAEYYEQFVIENDQDIKIGGINYNHLESLARTKLIPFETFFNINYYSLHQQGSHGANIFYAQSWALIHYLLHANNGANRNNLEVFLSYILNGKTPKDAFETTFKTDFATIEKELRRYIERNSYTISVAKFKEKLIFDDKMQTNPISQSKVKATLGDLLLNSGRLPEAEKILLESLALDAKSAAANASLGMLYLRQQNLPEAKKYIEQAVLQDDKNYQTYYRYAFILSREAFGSSDRISGLSTDVAEKMRSSLRKSIELNRDFPESYGLYAFVSVVTNDQIDEGIAMSTKALQLSPGNENHLLNLAGLYLWKGEIDKGEAIANAVFKSAESESIRVMAQKILQNAQIFRKRLEYQKSGNSPGQSIANGDKFYTDTPEPTEEEIEKRRGAAKNEMINDALRKPQPGETRVTAHLTKIDCLKSGIINYSLRTETGVMKLHSKDFQSLNLMAFVDTVEMELGCSGLKKETYILATYKAATNAKSGSAGELVSIELIPDDFVPRP